MYNICVRGENLLEHRNRLVRFFFYKKKDEGKKRNAKKKKECENTKMCISKQALLFSKRGYLAQTLSVRLMGMWWDLAKQERWRKDGFGRDETEGGLK